MWQDRTYPYLKYASWLLWGIIIVSLVYASRIIVATINDELPSFEELENPNYDEASIVYDRNGEPFGKYYVENRELMDFEDLSPYIVQALVATEDIRYYSHSGIDLPALFRVAIKTVLLGKESSGGGSTISQQLAKLLFERPSLADKGYVDKMLTLVDVKIKEWITAVRLEKGYTKEEIIAMYLNKFEFINGAHGIQSAAETYFGTDQEHLELDQAAVLVGMLKNPSLYNPMRFPENATRRRNVVLRQVDKAYGLDNEYLDTILAKPVDMSDFERDSHDKGPAPYFRSELTKWLRDLFTKNEIRKEDGTEYNIYTDGLKIYTTIDLNYQKHAEAAVREHMEDFQKKYWRVWDGMNPWNYHAGEAERQMRYETLERKIKASDRYLKLHDKFLGEVKGKIQEEFGDISMSENVIQALLQWEEIRDWEQVENAEYVAEHDRGTYRRIMKSPLWPELKKQFDALAQVYEKEFNKEIKMKVFAYNDEGNKEVTMSPRDSVKYHNQHLQASLLAVDPETGEIKAWVGGPGFEYFKYDHVNSRRQVGSTIKPFVYATAISLMGLSPCQVYEDIQYTIAPGDANFEVSAPWSPSNADEDFTGAKYNLYQGLLYSKNSITVRLVKEMGSVQVIREMLDNAGISKDQRYPNGRLVIPNVPSICLGAMDLTLYELSGAYTTFANGGVYTQPIFIDRIEDNTGKIIYTGVPERKQAINPLYNGVMIDMLKNNVGGRFGLGVKTDIGGKTGTTNDFADGWFMSVAPDLVTGVWVGGDDKWIRFTSLDVGQGYVMARPIVQKFIKSLEADSLAEFDYEKKFPPAPPGVLEYIDCAKYKQESVAEEKINVQLDKPQDMLEADFEDEFGDFLEETPQDTIVKKQGGTNSESGG